MRYFFGILFFLFSNLAFSQLISNFNVFQVSKTVVLKLTWNVGASCNGYTVFRSTDSLNFTSIYDYAGVCGSSPGNSVLTYIDQYPLMGYTNYYKIQLSSLETSDIKKVLVSTNPNSKLQVYPDPVFQNVETLNLRLLNINAYSIIGNIFDRYGTPLQPLSFYTTTGETSINVNSLHNGLYLIWLTDGTQLFASKFVIAR